MLTCKLYQSLNVAIVFILGAQSDELKDLVEDKEIAACAVEFVVNSTRKGIVPLCADVASLMRSKRRLGHFTQLSDDLLINQLSDLSKLGMYRISAVTLAGTVSSQFSQIRLWPNFQPDFRIFPPDSIVPITVVVLRC